MLRYTYYNQWLWVIFFIAWNVSTIHLLYFPQVTTFDLCMLINSEQVTSGHGLLQKSSTRFIKSCGLEVADFKNYEVVDLRLRTSRITKLRTCGCGFKNPETSLRTRLRTKLLNLQLRTCGCRLGKLKFGCGFADWGLKKTCGAQHCKPHCYFENRLIEVTFL